LKTRFLAGKLQDPQTELFQIISFQKGIKSTCFLIIHHSKAQNTSWKKEQQTEAYFPTVLLSGHILNCC
jgi:hypothetical protein